MATFVVLDPLLRGVGEHHFECDVRVLRAAQCQGWQPVLGAHQDLGHERELADRWQVFRAFPDISYEPILHKLHRCRRRLAAAEGRESAFSVAGHCRDQIDQWRYQRRHTRLTKSYRQALDEIWSGAGLARGDQVFLATAMPLDLAALADWARRNPSAREVDWHLQFHFPLVDAATWYARGSRQYDDLLFGMPEMLSDLLEALTRDRVHLYATTDALAVQLEHCLGERFETLPIPINPAIGALRARRGRANPLRAICAGQPRSEKSPTHWSAIVGALEANYFATGRLQIALQAASHDDLPEPLRRLSAECASPVDRSSPVALAGWPLSPPDYLEFLAGSSIGLLMYDPLAYHARISGVLVELLGAGVPVVVPAGCALADQVAEPIFAHQQRLRDRLPVVSHRSTAELDWKTAVLPADQQGIAVGVDAPCAQIPAAVAQTAVPAHASHLLILLARDVPNPWNRYASVTVEQHDAQGRPCQRSREIVGYRDSGGAMTVLVPLDGRSRQIEIRLQTAFGHEPLVLRRMDCTFLAAPEQSRPALGAVGRLASDPAQAAECLQDIVDHYDHYEKAARAFAADWAAVHTADQVLRDLTAGAAGPLVERRRAA
ncbi:MAG TPA: hypothetical protein VHY91_24420 [Pirellulales bacterium]|nr:hypothetical protein [Pirellulales bacterium]